MTTEEVFAIVAYVQTAILESRNPFEFKGEAEKCVQRLLDLAETRQETKL